MIKCRDNNMHIPYVMLITMIMNACEVDLCIESVTWCLATWEGLTQG